MEWLRETQWFWWVAAALVLLVIETMSLDFLFLMLGLAALTSAAAAGLGASFTMQVAAFALVSLLLLLVVRPIARRRLTPQTHRTNADALLGRDAVVLAEVTPLGGLVKLAGEEWSARSEHGCVHAVGEPVRVTRIDGATAVVTSTQKGDLR